MNIAQYQIDLEEVCLMDIGLCEGTQTLSSVWVRNASFYDYTDVSFTSYMDHSEMLGSVSLWEKLLLKQGGFSV